MIRSLENKTFFCEPLHKSTSFTGFNQLNDAKFGHGEATDLERNHVVGKDILLFRHQRQKSFEFSSDVEVLALFNA